MATPYVESSDDTYDHATDWQEIIDSASLPSNCSLSNDAQEAVMVGYIPANKVRSAARFFLQFAYCDSGSPYRLYRENPHRHPYLPWLYAHDFSVTPFLPAANTSNQNNEPYLQSTFDPDSYYAKTSYVVATVRYKSFRCDFLDDSDIGNNQDEWKRNTFQDIDTRIEVLTVTGGKGQLKFAEGTPLGKPFSAPLPTLLAKTGFTMLWTNVPWEYLSAFDDYLWPSKIMDCVGTVNSADFLDTSNPPGTILMQPPKFSVKPFPVPDTNGNPLWAVDVALNWEYFYPEKGSVSSYYGHNLMPWNGIGDDGGDGKFYYATRDGSAPGTPLIPATDHNTIFEHVME